MYQAGTQGLLKKIQDGRQSSHPTHHCGTDFSANGLARKEQCGAQRKFVQTSSSSICRFWTNYGLKVVQQAGKPRFWNVVTTLQVRGLVYFGHCARLSCFWTLNSKTSSFQALVNIKSRCTRIQLTLLKQ